MNKRLKLLGLFASSFFASALFGQPVSLEKKVAFESGRGTLTVRVGPSGRAYVLNREDRCVWIFDPSWRAIGRISSAGIGPGDLLEPVDLAIGPQEQVVVADGPGFVKVFDPEGKLTSSFEVKRPRSVGVLSDGRILVSGFPTTSLISVYSSAGRLLSEIGKPDQIDENPFFNSVLNHGSIFVDGDDNIYFTFRFLLTPTIRKYAPTGRLLHEWRPSTDAIAAIAKVAKEQYVLNKAEQGNGGVPILASAAVDPQRGSLWVAAGNTLTELNPDGSAARVLTLLRGRGGPIKPRGFTIQKQGILVATYMDGVFQVPGSLHTTAKEEK